MSKDTEFTTKDGWKVKIDNEVLDKMKEAKRERVENINECNTPASVAEYLEDNPFVVPQIQKLLMYALYKPTNLNFTQYQLKLQSIGQDGTRNVQSITPASAYAVLLRIMEIRFSLERLDL